MNKDFLKLKDAIWNYSDNSVLNDSNNKFYLISFLSFLTLRDNFKEGKSVDNFLDFLSFLYWGIKDKLNYFYCKHFWNLEYFDLIWFDKSHSPKEFFESWLHLSLDENTLTELKIIIKKDINNRYFWDNYYKAYLEDIFSMVLNTYYESFSEDSRYKKEQATITNTLSNLYCLYWNTFKLDFSLLKNKDIHLIECLMSFYYLWLLDIDGFQSSKSEVYFNIVISEELELSLSKFNKDINLIWERLLNEAYKKLEIKKKNWELHLLEWSLEIIWDENKFVDLRNKYPNSDINTKNYKWKTQKYEIKEKIKFNNENK